MFEELKRLYDKARSEYVRNHIREIAKYEFNLMFESSNVLTYEEIRLGETQGKIAAIREYRTRTGALLKEAKETVEGYFERNGLKFPGW